MLLCTQDIVDNVDNFVDNYVDKHVDIIFSLNCGYVEYFFCQALRRIGVLSYKIKSLTTVFQSSSSLYFIIILNLCPLHSPSSNSYTELLLRKHLYQGYQNELPQQLYLHYLLRKSQYHPILNIHQRK